MPHFIVECSENILKMKTADEIMCAVYNAAGATGLFAENDIKVRLNSYAYWKLGYGKGSFLHVFGNIMAGRTTEQKADLSRQVVSAICALLPDLSFVSMNISEFELETYCNKALIHPMNTQNDRHFDL